MNFAQVGLAAVLVLAPMASAQAVPMDYRFSFTGAPFDGSPEVVGMVRGLEEGINSVSSVEVIFNSLGYGIGTYSSNLGFAWVVTGGEVTSAYFSSIGRDNLAPDVTTSSIVLSRNPDGSGFAGLSNIVSGYSYNFPNEAPVFEKIEDTAPVPLPAAAGLLGVALLGLGVLGRLRSSPSSSASA